MFHDDGGPIYYAGVSEGGGKLKFGSGQRAKPLATTDARKKLAQVLYKDGVTYSALKLRSTSINHSYVSAFRKRSRLRHGYLQNIQCSTVVETWQPETWSQRVSPDAFMQSNGEESPNLPPATINFFSFFVLVCSYDDGVGEEEV